MFFYIRHRAAGTSGVIARASLLVCHPQSAAAGLPPPVCWFAVLKGTAGVAPGRSRKSCVTVFQPFF